MAIKKLSTVRRNKDRLAFILREIEIISSSAHPNIVRYIGCYTVGPELWVCGLIYLKILKNENSLFELFDFSLTRIR